MTSFAVLRPEPGNIATARRIEALGARAIRLPLFAVKALDWVPPEPADFDALLLTSANAVRFGGAGLDRFRTLPVLAVGAQTAAAANAAGFDVMASGDRDAAALIATAWANGVARALHLGGRERGIEAGGPVARAIAVYASDALPIGPGDLDALRGTVALLHSVRAATQLAELVGARRPTIGVAAFSQAVAAAAGTGWASIAIAAAPNDAALIEAALTRD
jgi:uroporphyrinogen-III synthase